MKRGEAMNRVVLFVWFIFLASCSRDEATQPTNENGLYFYTDKMIYSNDEKIVVKFENRNPIAVYRDWCRLYYKEKLENGIWDIFGEPPCPGGEFVYVGPHETFIDTIPAHWLGNGRYRLTADITLDHIPTTISTNEFQVTDIMVGNPGL